MNMFLLGCIYKIETPQLRGLEVIPQLMRSETKKGEKMKEYIVDIKGVVISEDEWKDTIITITRNGISDTLEFDKSDIVEVRNNDESEEDLEKALDFKIKKWGLK